MNAAKSCFSVALGFLAIAAMTPAPAPRPQTRWVPAQPKTTVPVAPGRVLH